MVLLSFFSVGLYSCGDDDNDETGNNQGNGASAYNLQSYYICPDENHPHLIDLGLPSGTKWSCCNIKATTPEDFGGYYAWGEIEVKGQYDLYNYSYWQDLDEDREFDENELTGIDSDIAGTPNDVAHMTWGGPWKIPTKEQYEELVKNTTSVWTKQNGVKGRKFVGNNGGIIFLPAGGAYLYGNSYVSERGEYCLYWYSSRPRTISCFFSKEAGSWMTFGDASPFNGMLVRPICYK